MGTPSSPVLREFRASQRNSATEFTVNAGEHREIAIQGPTFVMSTGAGADPHSGNRHQRVLSLEQVKQ